VRLKDYDEALQVEAERWPDRAEGIAAERERIAADLADELAHPERFSMPSPEPEPPLLTAAEVDELAVRALAAAADLAGGEQPRKAAAR